MKTDKIPVRELFGFERDPFVLTPGNIWLDEQRSDAVEQLHALVGRGGFAVLTGSTGCGKTILLGHLRSQLHNSTHRVIYIACSECGPPDMLRLICAGLDLEPTLGRSRMTNRITERVKEMKGVSPVLIVDEAQSLPQATLEVLRILCSHGPDGRNRFAVIMAGTEDFIGRLSLHVCEPLRQRVTVYANVAPLDRVQTRDYLRHKFETAGVTSDIIGGQAFTLLCDTTNGVPRRIDKLTDEALRRAAREETTAVTLAHVQQAARTVFGPQMEIQP
jgi:general secretion pathway protein A